MLNRLDPEKNSLYLTYLCQYMQEWFSHLCIMLFVVCGFFLNIPQKPFNTSMLNSLDPDQAPQNVGPDLGRFFGFLVQYKNYLAA